MRLKIHNASKAPDSFVLPLIQYAASFFPNVTGNVVVTFRETNMPTFLKFNKEDPLNPTTTPRPEAQKLLGGYCFHTGSKRGQISVRSTLNPQHPSLPLETKHLRYFAASRIPIQAYTLRTPEEIIIHVAAHEFAHLTGRGSRYRKSRIEAHCENRATEVLEAFRTQTGQEAIAAARAALSAPAPERDLDAEKAAEKAAKIANLEARLKRWTSKAKRAATAIKKLNCALKRLR